MKKYITLHLYKSFKKVNFYSFKFEDGRQTETDKFFSKFENIEFLTEDLNNLVTWISLIGEKYGAKSNFFRPEASAEALPPPMSEMIKEVVVNNLRLYCVRLNNEIVILANGGIKTAQKIQDTDIIEHFRFANEMSRQITELIKENTLKFTGKNISNLDEIELIY